MLLNEWVTELIHLKNREGVGPGHLFHLLHHLPVGDLYHKTGQSGVIKQISYIKSVLGIRDILVQIRIRGSVS